jgi:hypothetical protein
MPDDEDW